MHRLPAGLCHHSYHGWRKCCLHHRKYRKRGSDYAAKEVTHPTRIVTSTVCVRGGSIPMVSVKTAQDIPKEKIFEIMKYINALTVTAPVHIGDVLLKDIAGTGVDLIATKEVLS